MSLRVTLLPVPEPPMMTVLRPSGTSNDTSRRTGLAPNALARCSSRIIRGAAGPAPSLEQHQGPEGVEHQDRLAAEHHRARGREPDPFGARPGVETAEAAHERHRPPEARALHQPEPD